MASYQTIQNDQTLISKQIEDGRFECLVCPHSCKLRNGQLGVCQARKAENGVILEAYNKITHAAVEPIEKKPIYHYKPNLKTLSVGGYGCSMSCSYCQNWMVSQVNKNDSSNNMSPWDVCDLAQKKACGSVCFTYNEPIVYYEYIMDLAEECKASGLPLILKTNAYATIEIWKQLCKVSAAMNIDWKGSQARYSDFGVPDYRPVKDCIQYAVDKTHIEISVPVYYDSTNEEHEEFAQFMADFPDVPIHLLKIYPAYKDIGTQVTSDSILFRIRKLYKSSRFVYIQNVYSQNGLQDTLCPSCGDVMATRESLITKVNKESCCGCTIIKL